MKKADYIEQQYKNSSDSDKIESKYTTARDA